VHSKLGLGLECPDIGPNRILGLPFRKPKRIGFGQLGLSPIQFYFFFFISSFSSTPYYFFIAPIGLLTLLTRASLILPLSFSFCFLWQPVVLMAEKLQHSAMRP
jgi:hypothetical protein